MGTTAFGVPERTVGGLHERLQIKVQWYEIAHPDGRVLVFEEWENEADFAAHLAGPQYRGMLGHMQGYTILNAVTRKHRVTLSEPVYDPTGVPRADFFTR